MAIKYIEIVNGTSDPRYPQHRSNALAAGVFVDSGASYQLKFDQNGTDQTLVDLSTAQTLTSKTLTSPTLTTPTITGGSHASGTISGNIMSDTFNLAADATANSGSTGSTLTTLTGMTYTLVAGATYDFWIRGKVGMTTNGGLSIGFLYTTLTLTTIVVNSFQETASAFALAQSTTATSQTKFIDQKATAYLFVEMVGSLVVNAGGTLAVQFAQNTTHADTTTIYKGFASTFIRTL